MKPEPNQLEAVTADAVGPTGTRSFSAWIGWFACIVAAAGIWAIFWPGIFSADSLDQIAQSRTGEFHDWHPPFMAVVLRGLLLIGIDVSSVTLMQGVLMLLGVRAAIAELLMLQAPGRIKPGRAALLASAGALLLLAPLSPLAFHLVTLWKDCWLATALLWFVASMLRAHRAVGRPSISLAPPIALAAIMPLIRYNALTLLPAACVGIGWIAWHRLGPRCSAIALLPAILFFIADSTMFHFLPIMRLHPENQFKALELVGICVLNPEALKDLPFTAANLDRDTYQQRYRFGVVEPLIWEEPRIVTKEYLIGGDHDELGTEYARAWRRFPTELLRVKCCAFVRLLGTRETPYWFHSTVDSNTLGIAQSDWASPFRNRWADLAGRIAAHRTLRWIGAAPVVWFAVTLGSLFLLPLTRSAARGLVAVVLLLSLSYYCSYLIAAPATDFRLTYPATLLTQAWALAGTTVLVLRLGDLHPARNA